MTRVHVRRHANSSLRRADSSNLRDLWPKGRSNGREQPLMEFAGNDKPKRKQSKGPRACVRQHAAARELANSFIQSKTWASAPPAAIIGLYSLLHTRVYGVMPAELDGPDYMPAVQAAKRACNELTTLGTYELLRWTWRDEEQRDKKRRESNAPSTRIGWRLQFHASKITDFRVHQTRTGRRL